MGATANPPLNRVAERRRTVAHARHYREAEGMSIAQTAEGLGRAPATIKGYFYDPTGEKARAVKRGYQGVCRGCGAPTRTRDWVREAMHEWRQRYGRPPSSTDWSRTHARRRGG
jgi:hypothetical protein